MISVSKTLETKLQRKVVNHFDPNTPLVSATDASPMGLGAVLSIKLQNADDRQIAFASHSHNNSKRKYSQIDKEATAIYWAPKMLIITGTAENLF